MTTAECVSLSGLRDLLLPGQPVPFSVYDGEGRLLVAKGQPILNVEQLQSLLQRGASVQPEEAAAVRAARQAAAKVSGLTPSTRPLTLFEHWEKQVWGLDRALKLVGRDSQQAPTLLAMAGELLTLPTAMSTQRCLWPSARTTTALRCMAWRTRCIPRWWRSCARASSAGMPRGCSWWPPRR